MEALPLASVNEVPETGARVARVLFTRENVTTVLATGVAVSSRTCAVTVTELPCVRVFAKEAMVMVGVPAVPPTDSVVRLVA